MVVFFVTGLPVAIGGCEERDVVIGGGISAATNSAMLLNKRGGMLNDVGRRCRFEGVPEYDGVGDDRVKIVEDEIRCCRVRIVEWEAS